MAGFGRNPFGRGPFGKSDVGRDLIIELFPEEWLGEGLPSGVDPKNNDIDPLLKMLKTFANSVAKRREEVDSLVTLTDYDEMRLDLLQIMGRNLGLNIDKNEPEFIQRSFIGNASQWLQIKSSKQGYSVRGRASGFDVFVDNFWRIDPSYAPFIPLRNQFWMKPQYADPHAVKWLHTDEPPGTFAGTPTTEDPTYAKTAWLRITFEVAEPRRENVDYNPLLDLVILKITDVVGVHHELTPLQFRIRMNVKITMSVDIEIYESFDQIQVNEFYRYDITPADVVHCDQLIVEILRDHEVDQIFGYVNIPLGMATTFGEKLSGSTSIIPSAGMIASDENSLTANLTLIADILNIFSQADIAIAAGPNVTVKAYEYFNTSTTLSITASYQNQDEVHTIAEVFSTYDFIDGDLVLLDGPISVTMSIIIT